MAQHQLVLCAGAGGIECRTDRDDRRGQPAHIRLEAASIHFGGSAPAVRPKCRIARRHAFTDDAARTQQEQSYPGAARPADARWPESLDFANKLIWARQIRMPWRFY
jgi:hypothetical protein